MLERGPDRAVDSCHARLGQGHDRDDVHAALEFRSRRNAHDDDQHGHAGRSTDLLSGQTLWPSAGYFFGVPGLADLQEGEVAGALSDRVVAYDEDWTITLHAPYLDLRRLAARRTCSCGTHCKPGESRTFDAWLQVAPRGDLAPVVAAEIERKHRPSGIGGAVSSPRVTASRSHSRSS